MSEEIKLNKTVYNKDLYLKTIDTEFKQLGIKTIQEQIDSEITVDQFFEFYNELFYDIPETGNINSHEFLITQSSNYINFEGNTEEIEALQNEISQLRQELLSTQQQLIDKSSTQST
jgi:hypothetical protein